MQPNGTVYNILNVNEQEMMVNSSKELTASHIIEVTKLKSECENLIWTIRDGVLVLCV